MNSKAVARARAFYMYQEGTPQNQIAELLDVSEKTVSIWKRQDEWDTRQYARLIEQEPEWGLRLLALVIEQGQQLKRMAHQLQQMQAQLVTLGAPVPVELPEQPRKKAKRQPAAPPTPAA